jgi:hypothetical protein
MLQGELQSEIYHRINRLSKKILRDAGLKEVREDNA